MSLEHEGKFPQTAIDFMHGEWKRLVNSLLSVKLVIEKFNRWRYNKTSML